MRVFAARYEFWTDFGLNVSMYGTLDDPLPVVGVNTTPQPWGDSGVWVNLTRIIPPGSLCNTTWLLLIPDYPNISGLAVVRLCMRPCVPAQHPRKAHRAVAVVCVLVSLERSSDLDGCDGMLFVPMVVGMAAAAAAAPAATVVRVRL